MFEAAGMATVVIAVQSFRARMTMMSLPRVVLTPTRLGRPLGPPGAVDRQRAALLAALRLLDSARDSGVVDVLPTGRPVA